jgi:hypothetical protein
MDSLMIDNYFVLFIHSLSGDQNLTYLQKAGFEFNQRNLSSLTSTFG